MAEGTHLSQLLDTVSKHEKARDTKHQPLKDIHEMWHSLTAGSHRNVEIGYGEGSAHVNNEAHLNPNQPWSRIKLDFPRFLGNNPAGWIYKAEQYFWLYETPMQQRILMASYHMEDDALL
ncbi:hypothetical protein Pint_21071 [Pistacia integerrima]|uniref:Uncharacterized protein n=1 Tax=Pistacia integerrima TaxID=434235 RepID=A0ACC0X7R7_9ROSI|nr:hypothetical protein Pint_21071 [Pistacia integerrima]